MKKQAKTKQVNELGRAFINAYHGGSHRNKLYFTSDRYEVLDENFKRPNGKELKGFGLEIETENWNITDSSTYAYVLEHLVLECLNKDLFKLERDGSLRGETSAELITQIMTKEYIRNHYANFKELFNRFENIGTSCVRSGNCGMHINISNACFGKSAKVQDEAIRKLYFILNRYFNEMCIMLNRDSSRTIYCGRMENGNFSTKDAKTVNYFRYGNDHRKCLNFSHPGRVEIRLVGGQKNYACFRNTLETVFFLCQRLQVVSWKDLENFTEIFKGCNKYVYDRLSKVANAGYITRENYNSISNFVTND